MTTKSIAGLITPLKSFPVVFIFAQNKALSLFFFVYTPTVYETPSIITTYNIKLIRKEFFVKVRIVA